jgi:hypothetical protein
MSLRLLRSHRVPLLSVAVDKEHVLRHVVYPIVSGPGGPSHLPDERNDSRIDSDEENLDTIARRAPTGLLEQRQPAV